MVTNILEPWKNIRPQIWSNMYCIIISDDCENDGSVLQNATWINMPPNGVQRWCLLGKINLIWYFSFVRQARSHHLSKQKMLGVSELHWNVWNNEYWFACWLGKFHSMLHFYPFEDWTIIAPGADFCQFPFWTFCIALHHHLYPAKYFVAMTLVPNWLSDYAGECDFFKSDRWTSWTSSFPFKWRKRLYFAKF